MQTQTTLEAARMLFTLCLGCCAATPLWADESERSVTLAAIHRLENPKDLRTPGPRGELGPFQFRESTWRAYTSEPFALALDPVVSDAVAVRHYEWLKSRLEANRIPATTYTIALAWNAGVTAVVSGRTSRAARDYAQRAANVALALQQQPAAGRAVGER